jgi:hypothetical protein
MLKKNVKTISKKMKGGEYMPLYTETTKDWAAPGQTQPYSVDLNVGINEYTFGRTTPDNNFIVATGLVNDAKGIEMIAPNNYINQDNMKGGKMDKKIKKISLKKKSGEKKVVKKVSTDSKKKVGEKVITSNKKRSTINKIKNKITNLLSKTKKVIKSINPMKK